MSSRDNPRVELVMLVNFRWIRCSPFVSGTRNQREVQLEDSENDGQGGARCTFLWNGFENDLSSEYLWFE